MQVHRVEKRILILGINGAYRRHGLSDGLTPDQLLEQARDALCCRCGSDRERERDEIRGKDRTVIDHGSAEPGALARGQDEKLAPVGRAQRNELRSTGKLAMAE